VDGMRGSIGEGEMSGIPYSGRDSSSSSDSRIFLDRDSTKGLLKRRLFFS